MSIKNFPSDRQRKHIDLLSKIAEDVGFKNLKQTDISKYYKPEYIVSQETLNNEILQELLRFLKETKVVALE